MARKKLKTVTRATISEVMQSIRDGKRTPAEGLMRLTTLTAASPLFMWLEYSDAVKEVLPMVQWNPEGEEVEILGELPIVWREPLDFYNWADHRMGLAFSTGQYLRDFIAEQDAEAAKSLSLNAKEAVRRNAEIRADIAAGMTQAEVAEKYGLSQGRVSRIMRGTAHKGRNLTQLKLSKGTDPEAAAQRIHDRLGHDFATALTRALQQQEPSE